MEISIIGGAGHVGLPFGLVLADVGHTVTLVDQDESRLATISDGELPFHEPGGEAMLQAGLETGRIRLSSDLSPVAESDAVVVVIGTPIDEHHNPQVDPLLELVSELTEHLTDDQLLVLRSTIYPGTTEIVREELADAGFVDGENIHLSFAPERTAQHNVIEEIVELPQLIGSFERSSYDRTCELFAFLEGKTHRLRPVEAELGKLFTNMWRYLLFATANEFYLISESFATHHELNVHRILEKTAKDYPRFDVPSPGANVGGPCLTKDGWYLVDNIPFNELVSTAYQINEGMPAQIIDRMAQTAPDPEKIAVLGMTFKSNSDDIRNSVSFKMQKQLAMKGYSDVVCVESNVYRQSFDELEAVAGADWVVLMTPHDEFELEAVVEAVGNDNCLYCDLWGHWEAMKYDSDNGYFFGREVSNETPTTPLGEVER